MPTRQKSEHAKSYRIVLPDSGNWPLHDFYAFPRAYEQCYAFFYCLDTDLPERNEEVVDQAFENYPWQGGYSYVNFYFILLSRIPYNRRPQIQGFHKASPGWIDLALNIDVAVHIAKSVAIIAGSGYAVTVAYTKAWKLINSIKVERAKTKRATARLLKDEVKDLRSASEELAKVIGFNSLGALHKRTGNPETSLKLLIAQFRRLRTLQEYQKKSKILLPTKKED